METKKGQLSAAIRKAHSQTETETHFYWAITIRKKKNKVGGREKEKELVGGRS